MKHNVEEMRVSTGWNATCIRCDALDVRYVRLGALPFCLSCHHEFIECATPEQASEVYSKYLKKYLGGDE